VTCWSASGCPAARQRCWVRHDNGGVSRRSERDAGTCQTRRRQYYREHHSEHGSPSGPRLHIRRAADGESENTWTSLQARRFRSSAPLANLATDSMRDALTCVGVASAVLFSLSRAARRRSQGGLKSSGGCERSEKGCSDASMGAQQDADGGEAPVLRADPPRLQRRPELPCRRRVVARPRHEDRPWRLALVEAQRESLAACATAAGTTHGLQDCGSAELHHT
jgi:hypothetical protein